MTTRNGGDREWFIGPSKVHLFGQSCVHWAPQSTPCTLAPSVHITVYNTAS